MRSPLPTRSPSLLERLRRLGLRLTAQRRVVAQTLEGIHVHLTAEQVYQRARARLPEISRATVYNTLNQFCALGEVREITLDDGPKRYDPNAGQHHQHLICERCRTVRDVIPRGAVALPQKERHGFSVGTVEVVFRGLCPACAERSQATSG